MKSMYHPLRLKIVSTLNRGELSVQVLVAQVGTSQSNISQHLALLHDSGVLRSRRDGNQIFYRVGDQKTLEVLRMMQEIFCRF